MFKLIYYIFNFFNSLWITLYIIRKLFKFIILNYIQQQKIKYNFYDKSILYVENNNKLNSVSFRDWTHLEINFNDIYKTNYVFFKEIT